MIRRFLIAIFLMTGITVSLQAETLSLEGAVKMAVLTNPEVQSELREADVRERQVRQALGGYYPSVDLLAGFGFQERSPTANSDPRYAKRNELERREAQLNLRQLVFDGGETRNAHENQKARQESQDYRASSVGEDIALEVIRAYLDVMKQKEVLKIAQQTLATHEDIYDRMNKRAESGVGSTADLDQISSRLALAKSNVISQTANLHNAKTNFQRVVGSYPVEGELAAPGTYRKYLPATVESAIQLAQKNHPLLKSANLDIEAVKHLYEQTKGAFYPHFHVEVERDLNDNIDGVEEQIDDLKVMLRMRYNLFNGRSDEARKDQFAYLVEKAKEIRNNTHRQVEQEVRLSWVAHETLKHQVPVLESYALDAQETRDAYVKQFDLGRRTLLDLLNTENEMTSAKQQLVSAQHDLLFNEYRLFHAVGELLYTVGAEI